MNSGGWVVSPRTHSACWNNPRSWNRFPNSREYYPPKSSDPRRRTPTSMPKINEVGANGLISGRDPRGALVARLRSTKSRTRLMIKPHLTVKSAIKASEVRPDPFYIESLENTIWTGPPSLHNAEIEGWSCRAKSSQHIHLGSATDRNHVHYVARAAAQHGRVGRGRYWPQVGDGWGGWRGEGRGRYWPQVRAGWGMWRGDGTISAAGKGRLGRCARPAFHLRLLFNVKTLRSEVNWADKASITRACPSQPFLHHAIELGKVVKFTFILLTKKDAASKNLA